MFITIFSNIKGVTAEAEMEQLPKKITDLSFNIIAACNWMEIKTF